MTFYRQLNILKDKIFTLVLIVLVAEFCFPHQLLAKELDDSVNLGPVLIQIEDTLNNNEINQTPAFSLK